MFESRKKVSAEEISENLSKSGHVFNHLGISIDLNIKVGEKCYKILAKKGSDKVTFISGYVYAKDLDDIVNATNEELAEELLIVSDEKQLWSGKRIIEGQTFELLKVYKDNINLRYGRFVPIEHTEFKKYTQRHYLLIPEYNKQYMKILLNGKSLPNNFEIYTDGRSNGIQLVEKLRLVLTPKIRKETEEKCNLKNINKFKLSFHHAEDKRIVKDKEMHTLFNPFGILLGEIQNYEETSIGPERLTGVFYVVENGELKQTISPKILSERFANISPHKFVESDITLEDYLKL